MLHSSHQRSTPDEFLPFEFAPWLPSPGRCIRPARSMVSLQSLARQPPAHRLHVLASVRTFASPPLFKGLRRSISRQHPSNRIRCSARMALECPKRRRCPHDHSDRLWVADLSGLLRPLLVTHITKLDCAILPIAHLLNTRGGVDLSQLFQLQPQFRVQCHRIMRWLITAHPLTATTRANYLS